MERTRSLRRNVSFRRGDVNTAFERGDSSRSKSTCPAKLPFRYREIIFTKPFCENIRKYERKLEIYLGLSIYCCR